MWSCSCAGKTHQQIRLVAGAHTSPEPMRTWKIDGPPEIVDGIVM